MTDKKLHGILAEFGDIAGLLDAAEQVRDAGYQKWDVHSPIPIHGMDDAMGIKPTILPWLVLGAGLTGLAVAILMQWWMNAFDYPIIISGKPLFSLPANIPVAFELTVLFSALTAIFGLIALNGLPQFYHPLFSSEKFRRATSDRFFIYVEAADPKFDTQQTQEFLSNLGGLSVETVED